MVLSVYTLVVPNGSVALEDGVIVAIRHIHLTPADTTVHNVTNGEVVNVAIEYEGRSLVFKDTIVRENFYWSNAHRYWWS